MKRYELWRSADGKRDSFFETGSETAYGWLEHGRPLSSPNSIIKPAKPPMAGSNPVRLWSGRSRRVHITKRNGNELFL